MADPLKTNVVMTLADDPSLIRQGLNRYRIIVTPVSANGNMLGPFNESKILFSRNGHPLSLEIKDLMNGSYEAYLLLKKEEDPREIRLRIGDREFPQSLLPPRNRLSGAAGPAISLIAGSIKFFPPLIVGQNLFRLKAQKL